MTPYTWNCKFQNTIKLNFVKHLRIKISKKCLTQHFDVTMTSLSSDKDKTKNWFNINGLKWVETVYINNIIMCGISL